MKMRPAAKATAALSSLTHLLVLRSLFNIHTADALFIRPPSITKPYPPLRLSIADRLGIPYSGIAYDAGDAASLPSFALSLDATFGTLNRATFSALKKHYSGWSQTKPRVKWTPEREYTLLDFLPPLLQAVNGLHFRSSRSKQSGLPSFLGNDVVVAKRTEQEVLLATNCWGFAWEVLFQADNADVRRVTISTADPGSAWRAFTGRGFDMVQSSEGQPNLLEDKMIRNRKLRGGDVLLLWHRIPSTGAQYLDHVVIMLDKDLYYEKSGSGDNTPFRITTWEGLTANWPTAIFNWEWRRLRRNNIIPLSRGSLRPLRNPKALPSRLKSASDTFGLDSQVTALSSEDVSDRRFFLLSELKPMVAQALSLTAEKGDDGGIEASIYTGIWVLEDVMFDKTTGRCALPESAFTEKYMTLPRLPRNPYL